MTKRVVGYFENWAQYRQAGGKFFPAQINPSFFTHINFAFGLFGFVTWSVDPTPTRTGPQRLTGDYTIQPVEWNDQTVLYPALQALKQQNGNLKTLLSIGGWSMNSCSDTPNPGNEHPYGPYTCQLFSQMAADPNGRTQFINSAIAYAEKYGFDGIDIDWEYPSYVGRGGGSNDLANFLALVQEFRAAAGPDFLLTMAARAIVPTGLPQSYHDDPSRFFQWLQQCSQSFDWLNIESYDYHGGFDDPVAIGTGVNSPLPQDSTPNGPFSIKDTVDTYLAAGIPADKMVLGMPTYGRGYTVANPGGLASNSSYGQPFNGPSAAGPATQVPGVLAYYEITQQIAGGALTPKWDAATLTPYAYNATSGEWVSYDNPDSVAYKTAYVNAMNLGGAMIWSIDDDDFANGYPLLTKIKDILDHPEHGPQLPGGLTSPLDFPTDLLGLITGPWSNEIVLSASAERAAASPLAAAAEISGTPGVALFDGQVFAVDEGDNQNGTITLRTFDVGTGIWSQPVEPNNTNNGITGPPALAVYNDNLFCVHESAQQSGKLYYFFFNSAANAWESDRIVPHGTTVAGSDRHNFPSVALAEFKGSLHCVFEGGSKRGGGQLWHIVYNSGQWGAAERIGTFGTSGGPGLAVINGTLYCFHEGAYQKGQIWVTTFDGSSWSADRKVNLSTSGPPGLAVAHLSAPRVRNLSARSGPQPVFDVSFWVWEGPRQDGTAHTINNVTHSDAQIANMTIDGPPGMTVYGNTLLAVYATPTGQLSSRFAPIATPEAATFNLALPTGRQTAPYPNLPSYATDLRSSAPYNSPQYPVRVIRHHVIPYNVLVNFWNTLLAQLQLGQGPGRAHGLLSAMADTVIAYQNTLVPTDRANLIALLRGMQAASATTRMAAATTRSTTWRRSISGCPAISLSDPRTGPTIRGLRSRPGRRSSSAATSTRMSLPVRRSRHT